MKVLARPRSGTDAECARVLGDAAVVRQGGDRFSVPEPRRAQHQPLGLEDRNARLSRNSPVVFPAVSWHGLLRNAKRGDGIPSPLMEPYGPAGSTGCRQTQMCLPSYSAAASVIGSTDTKTRPLALVRNSTRPSVRANRVWSLPRPTFGPACHLVPRWRAMMLPATPARRRTSSRPDAGRWSRGRCGKSRLLFCEPWLVILNSVYVVARFRRRNLSTSNFDDRNHRTSCNCGPWRLSLLSLSFGGAFGAPASWRLGRPASWRPWPSAPRFRSARRRPRLAPPPASASARASAAR